MLTSQVIVSQHLSGKTLATATEHLFSGIPPIPEDAVKTLDHPVPSKGHRKSMVSASQQFHILLTQLLSAPTILPGKLAHGPHVPGMIE